MSANPTFAVIRDSGRQFCVQEGSVILLDRKDLRPGDPIHFRDIALFRGVDVTLVGKPRVDQVTVTGAVLGEVLGKKLRVYKCKKRKKVRKLKGHRQKYTRVKIKAFQIADA